MVNKLIKLARWTLIVAAFFMAVSIHHGLADAMMPMNRKLDDQGADLAISVDWDISPLCDISSQQDGDEEEGTSDTYSVIVVSDNSHLSNMFRDHQRMCTYSKGVVSAQMVFPNPEEPFESTPDSPPFYVGHPPGVSKRVRIYHKRYGRHFTHAMSHVKAACQDPTERTIVLLTDEFCGEKPMTATVPSACWSNMARFNPYSPSSPEFETRHAYIPLGPRDTFPFIKASERTVPASERPVFFNVAARDSTAPRRVRLVNMTSEVKAEHPEFNAFVNDRLLGARGYRSLLLDSAFTLCPGGHNPETFRMFESLEAGSIPILSRRDYLYPSFKAPFPCGQGDATWNTVAASPFAKAVSVASWHDLPELLQRLKDSPPEYINQLQAESVAWYEALMTRAYKSILNFGQGYEMWPQDGPIILDGFPARSEPYPVSPGYDEDEL